MITLAETLEINHGREAVLARMIIYFGLTERDYNVTMKSCRLVNDVGE